MNLYLSHVFTFSHLYIPPIIYKHTHTCNFFCDNIRSTLMKLCGTVRRTMRRLLQKQPWHCRVAAHSFIPSLSSSSASSDICRSGLSVRNVVAEDSLFSHRTMDICPQACIYHMKHIALSSFSSTSPLLHNICTTICAQIACILIFPHFFTHLNLQVKFSYTMHLRPSCNKWTVACSQQCSQLVSRCRNNVKCNFHIDYCMRFCA